MEQFRDIEELINMVDYDIGLSQNGRYHLNIARGLCYKALGETEKAIDIIESQIRRNEDKDLVGAYDYLHLGVLYLQNQEFEKAVAAFQKQSTTTILAENQYYLALAYLELDRPSQYKACLEKSRELYLNENRLFDPYSNPLDKIYLADIESELATANKKGHK